MATARGFEQFAPKAPAPGERRVNPFADLALSGNLAQNRATVSKRLRVLRDEGKLRLTDILCQPEPFNVLALECLTHIWKGRPASGDNPFGDMRFKFHCEATETREYKIAVDIVETVDVGGGVSVAGEVSEYQVLEPRYVKVPGGSDVELDVVRAIRLLQKYGKDLSPTKAQAKRRPWVEVDAPAESDGFEAVAKKQRAA